VSEVVKNSSSNCRSRTRCVGVEIFFDASSTKRIATNSTPSTKTIQTCKLCSLL